MKIFRATAAIVFLAAFSAASVFAQPKPNNTPATSTATANVPETKIALVDTEAFLDEKAGIARLVAAAKQVDNEFQKPKAEAEALDNQIKKLEGDLQKAAPVQDPKVSAQQQETIDQKKKELQRKVEDGNAAYQKRFQEKLGPVYEDIGKALDAYAKAHGITLILDVTKVQGIVSASDSLDITKAFIAEFNSKNPATASLTKPQ